jgi:hypothetical protein
MYNPTFIQDIIVTVIFISSGIALVLIRWFIDHGWLAMREKHGAGEGMPLMYSYYDDHSSTTNTKTIIMEIKTHTLAFVRWINACTSMEQLHFCNQAMLQFLIRGDNRYELPTAAWKDINTYLTLCMQNKHHKLQQVWFNNILTH